MTSQLPLITKADDWPEPDLLAWASLFDVGLIFDEQGAGAHWSDGTRRKLVQSYGYWLAYLERTGQLDPDSDPAGRFTPDALRAFHDDTRQRVSVISTSSQVIDLYMIGRALDPSADWTWFKQVADRLRRQPEHRELKLRIGITSAEIYTWALAEISDADQMYDSGFWERPICYRDGVMVALLIARPLRLRTFVAISIDQHLIKDSGGYILRFGADDMKDNKRREFFVPAELTEPMDRYTSEFRPRLLDGNATDRLWVSRIGGALSYNGLHRHLKNLTRCAFGIALGPHAFRHIAATSIAEEDPAHVNIIASLLGHATLTMSERHYNRATGVKAANAYQDIVRNRRADARRRDRIRRRNDAHRATDSFLAGDVKD